MNVPKTARDRFSLNPFARVVEVPTVFHDRCAERADCGVLLRIVSHRNCHEAGDTRPLCGKSNRLTVIPGARRDDAALALDIFQRCNEIQPAADLEGPRRVVILMFDMNFDARLRH
jgi:hypothetical protein